MKIRNRILLPFSISVFVFLIAIFIFRLLNNNQINIIKEAKILEQQESVDNIIKLRSDVFLLHLLDNCSTEYICNFVTRKDTSNASRELDLIRHHNLSVLWIYDLNKLIYSDFNIPIGNKPETRYYPASEVFEKLKINQTVHYFIYTENGLLEIAGSAIHRYNSAKVLGYFIIGKIWDKKYVNDIEKISNADINIFKHGANNTKISDELSAITIYKTFNNLNNQSEGELVITKEYLFLDTLRAYKYYITFSLLAIVLLFFIIVYITLQRNIISPLQNIIDTLNSGDVNKINTKLGKSDELKRIMNLIIESFKQKKTLENEIYERKEAEQAFLVSEKNYIELYNNMIHGAIRSTPEGKCILANMAFVNMLGYSSVEEVLKIDLNKDIYAYAEHRKVVLDRVVQNGYIRNGEITLKRKDGKFVDCLFNLQAIKDSQGKLLYLDGTLTDISEYKEIRTHLKKLEIAVSQSIDGMAIVNQDFRFEYVNESFAKMHGMIPDEIIGEGVMAFHKNPEFIKSEVKPLLEKATRGEDVYMEMHRTRKDGTVFLVLLSISVIKDYVENPIGFLIIMKDITETNKANAEIKRLNEELKQKIFLQNTELHETNLKLEYIINDLETKEKEILKSKQLYLNTINSSNEWIHYIDRSLKIVLINDSYLKINKRLGIPTDVIGMDIKEIYPFLSKKVMDEYDYVFETGRELITEDTTEVAGINYYTETVKSPVMENGLVTGIVTIIRDITERKEIERNILVAIIEAEEKEKKRFSEDLHDGLGALLSAMKIYVNTILKKKSIEEAYDLLIEMKDMIYEAVESTRGISFNLTPNVLVDYGLIRAIKNYSDKINRTQDIYISFNADDLVDRLNHKVEVNMFRIILELINNSLKHADAKEIIINIDIQDNSLRLFYKDDGKGFEKEKIFNKSLDGIGINNIFARVKLLSGICKIDTEIGKGMQVEISINNVYKN